MKNTLVLAVLVLCSGPAAAAAGAHCDATPFTLGKPAAAAPTAKSPKPSPQAVPLPAKKPEAGPQAGG